MDEELKEVLMSLINTVDALVEDIKDVRDMLRDDNFAVVQLGSDIMYLRQENTKLLSRVSEIERYLDN